MIRSLIILIFVGAIGSVFGQAGDYHEWQRFHREPVVVRYHRKDMRNAATVMNVVHRELDRIAADLRLGTIDQFTVIVASTEQEFHAITGGEIPEWGIGAADPVHGILFIKSPRFSHNQADLQRVVVHELSHVLLGMVLGGRSVDRWFDEGFALFQSGELGMNRTVNLARSLFTDEFLPLDQIDEVLTFQHEKASLAYQESRSAVDYFMKIFGKEAYADIAWLIHDGHRMEEAFYQASGVDISDFEDAWIQSLRKRYFLYPFLQFPYILSALFIILFISAYVMTRYRIRKKKIKWEQEELYEVAKMEENTTSH